MKAEFDDSAQGREYVSIAPPHPPWQELHPELAADGYLSFYYSDDLSPLAVRAVTRERDNKTDPNIETGTYGLFSTCSKAMRKSVVKRRCGYVIFMTRRGGERVIVGYYKLGWFAPTLFADDDFCLAAKAIHFVAKPIRFAEVKDRFCLRRSRLALRLSATQVRAIVGLLNEQSNVTDAYIREVRRLEQFNLSHTGKRYVNFGWLTSPDWERAERIFAAARATSPSIAKTNKSPTDWWRCRECGAESHSESLLKCCPACEKVGSLEPVEKI